jgi:hypothetical protein
MHTLYLSMREAVKAAPAASALQPICTLRISTFYPISLPPHQSKSSLTLQPDCSASVPLRTPQPDGSQSAEGPGRKSD